MGIALKIIINHPIQEVEFISYATWGSLWWEFPMDGQGLQVEMEQFTNLVFSVESAAPSADFPRKSTMTGESMK